ncbi:MAG: dipeptidase [Chloroflexaceae bacterium]|nr:dipeptidase [Chloroflexaceae bacterium]
MRPTSEAIAYVRQHHARFLRELQEFVRIPSVSAQPRHAGDVRRCAEWLAEHLRQIGMEQAVVEETARHPVVSALWRRAPGRPTVLIYGHYDVQPAGRLEAWAVPPFAAAVVDGALYGRGASDDKGPLFAHVKALEAYLRAGGPPLNVVCLFEGEEEIGSPSLRAFLEQRRRRFAADVAVASDTRFLAPGRPAIIYALRGGLSLELELRGQRHDLHSGIFGGAIHNPLQAICELVARLHSADGRVAIPGFYRRVRRVSLAERAAMARVGPSDAQILRDAGTRLGWGEVADAEGRFYTLYERTTIRPALTINGLTGGYQGPGNKAVIPARALAKLSFRLVPDQEPDEIARLARRQIARLTPATMRGIVRVRPGARPIRIDPLLPAFGAAARAYRHSFGVSPVLLRSGGSIPVVALFQELLGIPTVLMGLSLPDDGMHGPNERFRLGQFYTGIETCVHFLAEAAHCEDLAGAADSLRKGNR